MEIQSFNYISVAFVVFMFVGFLVIYGERIYRKKGVGARTIQITGVVLMVPLIGILALQGVLEKQTTATLLGALTGYLLSGIGSFEPSNKNNRESND